MDKPAHVARMEGEYGELSDRIAKLDIFVGSDLIFPKLSKVEQGLLIAQREAMKSYQVILGVRLGLGV